MDCSTEQSNRTSAKGNKEKMIKKVGSKWVLFTKSGKRKLGTHTSKAAAQRQEKAIWARRG